MTVPRKTDSEKIIARLRRLKAETWLTASQNWWSDFLFRVDPIEAAASILNCGKLLSRHAAIKSQMMTTDCANPGVIATTADKWKDYVRLYFRPRTPTQYVNEGFRPIDKIQQGAHCPVPIVMLFDAQDILTRQSTEFSEGNLAKYPSTGNDSEFFDNIPFKEVYHDDRFDKAQRDNIVFRRHAEVMIPTELDLSALRFVGCRTQAEYETLMFLLTEESRAQWSGKIGLSSRMNLHNRMWTFVEQAVLTPTKVTFTFNPSTLTPGPFSLYFEVVEQATGKSYIYQNASATCSSNLVIALKSLRHPENYSVRLTLDEKLAYSSRYSPSVKPL